MQKYDYDIIVVGAGPAGCTTAMYAARKGLRVLLLDKKRFPRDKTCGDLIPNNCLHYLEELHLSDIVKESPHLQIRGAKLYSANGNSITITLSHSDADRYRLGFICQRKIFDNVMIEATKKLVDYKEQFLVSDVLFDDSRVIGVKGRASRQCELSITAKVVVGADGFNSVIARKTRAYKHIPKHCLVATRAYYRGVSNLDHFIEAGFLKELHPGYFWIFPTGNGVVNIGLGTTHHYAKKKGYNLRQLHDWFTTSSFMKDRFGEAERVEKIKGWNLPTPDNRRKIYGNGFLLVGDAAGLVNPLTGGGIDNAMHSGKVAAECSAEICRGSDYSEKRLSNYASRLWKELGENQFKSEYRLQRLGSLRAFHSLFNLLVSQVNAKPELSNCIRFLVVDGKPANNRKLMTLLLRNLV